MNQRLLIALLTVVGFAAGFAARTLTEKGPTVPPPPAPGTEFVRTGNAASATDPKPASPSPYREDRDKLLAEIQKIRPQIDDYRRRIEEIACEFDAALLPLLTPEQQEKFKAQQKRMAERRAEKEKQTAEVTTLSDEQILRLQREPLWNALWNVAIQWRLERMIRDFGLTDVQQAQVRELLQRRREKFLALVDATPPPSITLSQLATQTEKLGAK